MVIERTEKELILKLPLDLGIQNLDKIIRYLKYTESNSNSIYNEEEINQIANESKQNWWLENKHRYIK